MRLYLSLGSALLILSSLLPACNDIPADNPFDPKAPPSVQEKSDIRALVRFPAGVIEAPEEGRLQLLRLDTLAEVDSILIDEGEPVEQEVAEEGTPPQLTIALTFRDVTGGTYILEPSISGFIPQSQPPIAVQIGTDIETLVSLINAPIPEGVPQGVRGVAKLQGRGAGGHAGILVSREGIDDDLLTKRTEPDGSFFLPLPTGEFSLKFSYEGYKTITFEGISISEGVIHQLSEFEHSDQFDGVLTLSGLPGVLRGTTRLICTNPENPDEICTSDGFAKVNDTLDSLTICARPINDEGPIPPRHCDAPSEESDETLSRATLEAWVDEEGIPLGRSFVFDELNPGQYLLVYSHPNYQPMSREVSVTPGGLERVDEVHLEPISALQDPDLGVTISGIVRLDGQPNSGGVTVKDTRTGFAVDTLGIGEFSLSLPHHPDGYTLEFTKAGYLLVTREIPVIERGGHYRLADEGDAPPVDLVGAPANIQGALRLRLTTPDTFSNDATQIMEDTIVCARPDQGEVTDVPSTCAITVEDEGSVVFATPALWSDDQGGPLGQTFIFEEITAGRYKVIYTNSLYDTTTETIEVAPGAIGRLPEVHLTPTPERPVSVTGHVILEGQDEFSGITVRDERTGIITETVNVGALGVGVYSIGLPYHPGGHTLEISKAGFHPHTLDLPVIPRGDEHLAEEVTLAVIPAQVNGRVLIDAEAILQIDPEEPRPRERQLINTAQASLYRLQVEGGRTLINTMTLTLSDTLSDNGDEQSDGGAEADDDECVQSFPPPAGCARQIGIFSFEDLSIGQYELEVQLEAFVTETRSFSLAPNQSLNLGQLFLTQSIREATITGRVLIPCLGDCDHSGIQVSAGSYTTLTGPDGSFRLVVNAVPVPYEVYASKDGYQRTLLGEVTLEPGETRALAEQTLAAQPGQISGIISLPARFDTAQYLPQVSLTLRPQPLIDGQLGVTRTPNPNGLFSFDAVTVGAYLLNVSAPGFVPIDLSLEMGPGEIKSLNVINLFATDTELIRGVIRLEGVADVDRHGDTSILMINTPYSALSNADGTFLLQAVPGDGRLRISKVGYESRTIEFDDLAVGELRDLGELDLAFEPATISGAVAQLDALDEAAPAIGAILSLTRADGIDGTPRDEIQGIPAFISGNDGAFTSPELLGGQYLLTVSKEGYVTQTRAIDLPLGASISIDEITLDLERGSITGTARRADLASQGGITVRVLSLSDGAVDGVIDRVQLTGAPEDRFTLSRLPIGSYRVEAFAEGYQPATPADVVVSANAETSTDLSLTAREYSLTVPPLSKTDTIEASLGGDADLTHYRFWLDGNRDASSAWILRPDETVSLEGLSEGAHVVFFELATQSYIEENAEDPSAYISPTMSASFRVDTASPEIGQVAYSLPSEATQIDEGAGPVAYLQTGRAAVALFNALDPTPGSGISSAKIDSLGNNEEVLSSVTVPFSPVLELTAALNEGLNQYRVQLIDAAGNESAPVTLPPLIGDSLPPIGTLSRLSPQQTSVVNVTLQLDYRDDDDSPVFYRLYQTDQNPSAWQPLPSGSAPIALNFTLTPGESGDRVVTGDVRDASGRLTALNDVTFRYDNRSASPPQVLLNQGASWTNTPTINLSVADPSASDNEANGSYTLIIGGEVDEAGEYAYDLIPDTLTLSGAQDGEKRLSFLWVDGAGNRSPQTETSISIDRVLPSLASVTLSQPEGRRRMLTAINGVDTAVLYLKTDDAVVAVLSSFDPTPSSDLISVEVITHDENDLVRATETHDYAALLELTPAADVDFRWYELTVIDAAGNRSAPLQTVMVKGDQASPTGTLAVHDESTSNSTLFTLDLNVADDDGSPLAYRLYQNDQSPGAWVDIPSGTAQLLVPFTVTAGTAGDRTITGQLKDAGGRLTQLNDVTVRYDANASDAPVVTLDGGAIWTTDLSVSLSVTPPVANDGEANGGYALLIEGEIDLTEVGTYTFGAIPETLTLLDGEDGIRQVDFTWIDAAGNASTRTTEMIYIDRVAPEFAALSLSQPEGSRRMTTTEDETTINTVYLKTDDAVVAVISALDPAPSSDLAFVEVVTYLENDVEEETQTYPYSAVLELSPTASADLRSYGLTLIDSAGNRSSALRTDFVKGDSDSPTGSLAINGESVSNSTLFNIDLTVADADASPLSYRLYQADQSPGSWVDIEQGLAILSVPFTVTAGETGSRSVTGALKDASGRTSTLNTVTLRYDTTRADAPEVTLDGGAVWTTDLSVSLSVDPPVSSDVEANGNYTLIIAGDALEVGEYPFGALPANLTLRDGDDGLRTIRFIWVDEAGNASIEASEEISIDRVAPTLSAVNLSQPEESRLITVTTEDQGVSTTTSTQYLQTEDAVVAVLTANDLSPSSEIQSIEVVTYDQDDLQLSTETYDYTTLLELSPNAVAGLRRYTLTLIDTAGNRSDVVSTPYVRGDQVWPTGTLSVEGITNSRSTLFTLKIEVDDDDESPLSYRLYQTDQAPGGWFDIDPNDASIIVPFTVTAGSTGDRVVTGQIKDASGRTTSLNQVTLRYDTTAPDAPIVTVNQGQDWASTIPVPFSVSALTSADGEPANQHELLISGQTIDTGVFTSNTIPNPLRLSPGPDGTRLLRFAWRDDAGNRSDFTEVTILLDREPPTLANFILGEGTGYTISRSVDLEFSCLDSMSSESELSMIIESPLGNSTINIAETPYSSPIELTLDPQVGLQAVTIYCMDAAGNMRARSGNEDLNLDGQLDRFVEDLNELKIYFDNVPPVEQTFTVAGGVNGVSVNSPAVTVTTDFSDAGSGMDRVAVSELIEDCASADYIYPAEGEFQFLLSDPDGNRRLSLCAKDHAGNTLGPIQSNLVNLDRVSPNFTAIVGDGSGWTSTQLIALTLASTDDDPSGYTVEVTGDLDATVSEGWPISGTLNLLLSAGAGEKEVTVNVIDEAGNQAAFIRETLIFDEIAPVVLNASIGADEAFSDSRTVDLSVSCLDDFANANEMTLQVILVGQVAPIYNGTYTPLIAGLDVLEGEGGRQLRIFCIDPAGQSSDPAVVSFNVDTVAPSVDTFTLSGLGPAGYSRALQLTATIEVSDATSGVDRLAIFEDGNISCADASYLTSLTASDNYGATLTAGDGTRTVYLCLQDRAGNQTADRLSATIEIDTTIPDQGTLDIENGDEFTNTTEVDLTVTALEAAANLEVGLIGDFVGAPIFVPLTEFPKTVFLTNRNGVKNIQAVLRDVSGNISSGFSASIRLDRTSPADGVVAYDFQPLSETPLDIQELNIPLSILLTIADYMQLWEVPSANPCDVRACGHASDELFSANTSFTFGGGDGEKRLCWRFCDEAGNASETGTGLFDLTQQFEKPRPVLTSVTPEEYTTYSMVNETMTLTLTLTGDGIAANTQVQIGDYVYSCDTVTRGNTPIDPTLCTQNQQNQCGTECTVPLSLTEGLLKFAGRYLVRLITPAPVFGGNGSSEAEVFFTVKAPPPSISYAGTHGVVREQTVNSQSLTLGIVACNVVDNASFSFADQIGEIIDFIPDADPDGCDYFKVLFEIGNLNPYIDLPYQLKVVNPSPGGGFSEFPFALAPPYVECSIFENCVYTLHNILPSAGLNSSLLGSSMTLLASKTFAVHGSSLVGVDGATISDRYRNILSSVDLNASGGALPLLPEITQCSPYVSSQLCPSNNSDAPQEPQRLVTIEDHRESASQGLLHAITRKDFRANRGSGELRRYIGCPGEPANQTETLAGGVNRFALGDLDHDNDLDIVTAHTVAGEVQIRLGSHHDTIKNNGQPLTKACTQDINADGVADDCTLYAFTPIARGGVAPVDHQLDQGRIPMGDGAYDVTLSDLNQDGILDIITPDSEADTISIRFGNGDGSFRARSVINTDAEGPVMVKVADMNQDGWSDLIVAFCGLEINLNDGTEDCDASKGGVRVYLGNKRTQYTMDPTRSLTAAISAIDVADVNNDGALDIVASDHESVQMYTSITTNGSLSSETPWSTHTLVSNANNYFNSNIRASLDTRDIQIADWDGDGSLDIIFSLVEGTYGANNRNYISVLLNDGKGQYPEVNFNANQALTELYQIEQMLLDLDPNHPVCPQNAQCQQKLMASQFTIGEFTGDGRPDLAIALFAELKDDNIYPENNWIAILPGGETTRFDPTQLTVHSTVSAPGVPDANKKCKDYQADTGLAIGFRSSTRVTDLKAVDLDGDGAQDLLALSSDAQSEFLTYPTKGALMGWRGGHFPDASTPGAALGRSYSVSWANTSLLVGGVKAFASELVDLNNDGALDLVWHDEHVSSGVQIIARLNQNGLIRSNDEAKTSYGQNDSTGAVPIPLSIGDVDGDGDDDIVVALVNENLTTQFPPPSNHSGFKIYEWNASSLSCTYPSNCPATGVIVNNFTPGVSMYDLKVVEDLGNNATLDRGVLAGVTEATTDREGNQVITNHLYLFQRNGTTFSKTEEALVQGSSKIVIGKVNQDLYTDVVSIGNGKANVLTASGSFTNGSYFESNVDYNMTNGTIWGTSLTDLDGDGDEDLIVLSEDSNLYSLSVRLNENGSFGDPESAPFTLTDTQEMVSLRVTDMNNDQIADLIIGNGVEDSATIIYGPYTFVTTRAGSLMSYAGRIRIPMGRNVRDVNFGDINQDGAVDLISANGSASIDETGLAGEVLTVWEAPQAGRWRESLVLRSAQTTIPSPAPNVTTVTFPNVSRFIDKATLSLKLEGDLEFNTSFSVNVTTPEGQLITILNNDIVTALDNYRFTLPLAQKWQRGGEWSVSVTGGKILDAKIALESWFNRPDYRQSPCTTDLEGAVRLVNTRLELCHSSQWGTVCDDSPVSTTIFDAEAIDVLCQSLGFTTGEQVVKANVPEGAGQIWLDNLDCVGTESSITECAHLGYGVNNCSHSEDVGIRCY